MSLRSKFKKQKKQILQKQQNGEENFGGTGFSSIFDLPKVPEGIEFWKCKEGTHTVDIIPFEVGSNHPKEAEGNIMWVLDLWVHFKVGPRDQTFVCPSSMWGDPCPICEYIKKNNPPKEERNQLRAKHRNVWLIWVHDNAEEEEKGIQIWEVAHWFMKDKLDEIQVKTRGGGYIPYYDPEEGQNIVFSRRGSGMENTQYLGHRFETRPDQVIPEDILNMSFPLDDCVKMKVTYEELYEAFYAEPVPDADGSKKTNVEVEEEEIDYEEEDIRRAEDKETEEPDCPAGGDYPHDFDELKACRKCTVYDACEADYENLTKSKKVEEVPSTRRSRRKREEEEDIRQAEEMEIQEKGDCPAGGDYPHDFDELKACRKCTVYDACEADYENLTKSQKVEEVPSTRRSRRKREEEEETPKKSSRKSGRLSRGRR